jgi:hypothetical protein
MKELYGEGVEEVEVIGWRWAERFLHQAETDGIRPWRLHGRTGLVRDGVISGVRSGIMQKLLLPTGKLVSLAKRYKVGRILVHTGEAREGFEEIKKAADGMSVGIENSLGGETGLRATFALTAELVKAGVRAGVVADAGHFGYETGKLADPETVVREFLDRVDEYEREFKVTAGVHLPINAENDEGAINIDKLTDEQLRKFLGRFEEIVVENRADLVYEFWRGAGQGYKRRTQRRWQRLRKLAETD